MCCRKDIFYHLCGGRQDNKVVGTDIQMGPFVWVNKEFSLHDRPILTFLPALIPHEHTFNPSLGHSLCVCVHVSFCDHASLVFLLHTAERWLTGQPPSFLQINQWYAREGGFWSRRLGVSLNKRCWWWSGCCIISASQPSPLYAKPPLLIAPN